jgi:long-chain acyl-CoA synthetase
MTDTIERLLAAGQQLTQAGASHELTTVSIGDQTYTAYVNAPQTLREALAAGRAHGDKTFLVFEAERWTFTRFFNEADSIAELLVSQFDVVPGDRVAIAMRNYPEWMAAYVAIVSIGAIVVPLNSWGQADELVFGLTDAGANVFFCDQQRLDYVAPRLAELGLQAIVARPEKPLPAQAQDWRELVAQASSATMPECDIAPDAAVMIMYTSGTTGRPKGAVSSNRAVCQALHNFDFAAYSAAMSDPAGIEKMMSLGLEPATLLAVPLFHVSGCFAVFMLNLRAGRKTVMLYKWDAKQALELIEAEQVTTFSGVPAMNLALLEQPEFEQRASKSLFALGIGGAATPPHLATLMETRLPGSFSGTGYGMTESCATGATCTGAAFRERPGSSGWISPLVSIKTVDEAGNSLPRGERGEIYLRSVTNVHGYWNLPEATADAFQEGWLATGDVGYVDENNFLYVVDRIKDMVIRGGENIYPVEIENCIIEHPQVIEVTAYGLPDESLGEILAVSAYVEAGVSAADIKDWVSQRLAGFKVPGAVRLCNTPLPKNPTGKILKKQVCQLHRQEAEGASSPS